MIQSVFLVISAINLVFVCQIRAEEDKELFKPNDENLGADESKYVIRKDYLVDSDFVDHKHKYDKYHGPYSQTLKPIAAVGDPHEYPDKLEIYKAIKPEKKYHYVPKHEIVTLKPIDVGKNVDFHGYQNYGEGQGVIYATPVNYGHEEPGLYKDLYKELDNQRHRDEYNKDLYQLMDQQPHKGVPYAVGVAQQESPYVIDKPVAYGYPVGYEHTNVQIPQHNDGYYYHREEKKPKKSGFEDKKKKLLLKPIEWFLKAKKAFWKL